MNSQIHAICFDVFGTLLEITERRSPYRQFMTWMQSIGRQSRPDDVARIMSLSGGLEAIAGSFGVEPPAELLALWNEELLVELASIRPFPDTLPALRKVQIAGYRIGVCSNLAFPYADVVRKLLPPMDAYAMSCELGVVKPSRAIYQALIDQLGCNANNVLFIGDTPIADVEGPLAFGMEARLINRKEGQTLGDVLNKPGAQTL